MRKFYAVIVLIVLVIGLFCALSLYLGRNKQNNSQLQIVNSKLDSINEVGANRMKAHDSIYNSRREKLIKMRDSLTKNIQNGQ